MKFVVATKNEFRVHHTVIVQARRDVVIHLLLSGEDSLVRHDEGSTESEERNDQDPDEQELDENTDDDEDIEDEPTAPYFMDDEWQ